MKFKFECQCNDKSKTVLSVEFECESIDDVIDNIILFLRGAGFHTETIRERLGDMQ